MNQTQDCPMCGETMRLKVREQTDYIPGQSQVVRTEIKEWICPDCDYFEEYEESTDEPSDQP
jgi:C4-type Zn-finger protein